MDGFLSEDPAGQTFAVSRQNRDATVVIRGYVYQVNTTLLKWIDLEPDQLLELEAGEDIDALQGAVTSPCQVDRLLEAVKCREKNLTLRSPEALSAIATFHEHRQRNPTLRLGFRYITNSSVGEERPPITDLGTPGIHLWERVRNGLVTGRAKATVLSAVRRFLRSSTRPSELSPDTWESFQRFLKRCTLPELNRLMDGFEWSTEHPSPDDLEGRVRYALVASGRVKTVDDAEAVFQHLFHFVFALLSKRSAKILTRDLLLAELKKLDQVETGRNILSHLIGMEVMLQNRFDRLEEQIAPLQSDMHGVKASLARIEGAVTSLQQPVTDMVDGTDTPARRPAAAPPAINSGASRYQMSVSLPTIVSSALLAQNEELAAAVVAHAKGQIAAIRDAARKGLRSEALNQIAAQRDNRVAWQVLPNERKAELLRLEASILLNSADGANKAKELLEDAARVAPMEDDSRLRACIAFSEGDSQAAISLLEGKQQPESRNLLALLLLLTGRHEDAWQALPPFDSDAAVRAETLRVRALALLHRRDLPGARAEIDAALVAEPDWPALQFVSASISYYEALSPCAVPLRLQDWPEPSNVVFRLNTTDAKEKLREAADVFLRLARLTDSSAEERRLSEVWHFACLVCDFGRREEARQYALTALAADPGQYRLVPWILAQRYAGFDLTATREALAARVASAEVTVFEVIALVMLQLEESSATQALATLNATEKLFLPRNANAWHHWRAIALLTAGGIKAAEVELERFDSQEKADPLWSEIQRHRSRESGDWGAYEEELRSRYASTKSPDALLEYCEFAAHRRNWDAVAALGGELANEIGTPETVCLAAIAAFNAGKPRQCLELLELHPEFCADEFRGEELQRLHIASYRKLGQLVAARRGAEELVKTAPTTENLLSLAQLQLDMGDPKALALNARQLAQRSDLSSEKALRIAMLVRHEDTQLAQSLWRRAMADAVPDDAVGAAMSLGYHLGLDRELRPLLARMNELAERGKGGIEKKTFPDLIELIKTHQKNVEWLNDLYNKGEMAIHLIPTRIRAQLVDLYHSSLAHREDNPELPGPCLFAIHGGRPWLDGFPREVPAWRLNLDITSLLLARHLGILPKVEKVFGPLRVAPSIFAALGSMQDSLLTAQLTQIDATRDVLACVESGLLSVLDNAPLDPPVELVSYGGLGWAMLYSASRQTTGRVVDFVPKITTDPKAVAPSDAETMLLNCRTLIESLRQQGAISADEYISSIADLGAEGQQAPVGTLVHRGTNVYCQNTMAKLLAGARLLRPACRVFRLHLLREDVNELKGAIRYHEQAKETAEWVRFFMEHIRQGIDEKRYHFIARSPVPEEDDEIRGSSFDVKCLTELLTFPPETADVIWADDRYLNAYSRRDSVPIISSIDVLKALVTAKELTRGEYYRLLNRLRAGKCSFIPLESEEILHHLIQAPVASYTLSETPALGTLRRYWAENLLRGSQLQKPGTSSANAGGETAFLLVSANAVRDALVGLWAPNLTQTDEERETRAGWLLEAMYTDHLGIRSVALLPSGEIRDHELVGVSLGSLVAGGFEMRLQGRYTSRALRDYLHWLYHRLLHPAFERDRQVLQSAGVFIRTTLQTLWQGVQEGQKPPAARLIQFLLELLPDELREIAQADADFSSELKMGTVSIVQAGPLKFLKTDYLNAAREAVNGRCAKARLWRSEDEVEFESAKNAIALKPRDGETIHVADPLLSLLSDQAGQRETALKSHPEWFDCDPVERAQTMEEILCEKDPLIRWETAEEWREQSASVFYADLARRLSEKEIFLPDDIRPPSAKALLRHYRLGGPPGVSPRDQIETGVEQILQQLGLAACFVRYAGLPVPLPAVFFQRVDALSEAEKREFVKQILRVAPSPISAIHFLRLLSHLADTPESEYWRLATRAIRALLKPEAIEQFRAFRNLVQWTDSAFGIWPQARTWTETERLALVWAHSHRVFSTFTYLGVPSDWILDRFKRADFGLCCELFGQSPEYSGDVAHPKRVLRDGFLLSGLAYAVGQRSGDWWGADVRQLALDLVHPSGVGEPRINVELLRNSVLAGNLLGSFLAGDRSQIPYSILGDGTADYLQPSKLEKLGADALQAVQTSGTLLGWSAIYRVFGDLPLKDCDRELVESAILKLDLAPLERDLAACDTLLHAASLQAAVLQNTAVIEHLSEQTAKMAAVVREQSRDGQSLTDDERQFLSSLFQVAINLSRNTQGGVERASEYARLFARIADAFPRSAAICRHFLNRIWPCEASQAKTLWPALIRSRAMNL